MLSVPFVRRPRTVRDLVEAAGGIAVVARQFGMPLGTVSAWCLRNRLMGKYADPLLEMIRAAGRGDISADEMLAICASNPRKRRAPAGSLTPADLDEIIAKIRLLADRVSALSIKPAGASS